jgi:hypothetical protein
VAKRVVEVLSNQLEDADVKVSWAAYEVLKKLGTEAPTLSEVAAKAAIGWGGNQRLFGKALDLEVAERFSDSVRIQRRANGWAVACTDRLQECGEVTWSAVP